MLKFDRIVDVDIMKEIKMEDSKRVDYLISVKKNKCYTGDADYKKRCKMARMFFLSMRKNNQGFVKSLKQASYYYHVDKNDIYNREGE